MSEMDGELRVEYRGRDCYIVSECPNCGGKAEASISSRRHDTLPHYLSCHECDEWGERVIAIRREENPLEEQ